MTDVILVVVLVVAFLLAIGLVRVLDRLITKGAPVDDLDGEPPADTDATTATDSGRSR